MNASVTENAEYKPARTRQPVTPHIIYLFLFFVVLSLRVTFIVRQNSDRVVDNSCS
jgi:hypothetical protein